MLPLLGLIERKPKPSKPAAGVVVAVEKNRGRRILETGDDYMGAKRSMSKQMVDSERVVVSVSSESESVVCLRCVGGSNWLDLDINGFFFR